MKSILVFAMIALGSCDSAPSETTHVLPSERSIVIVHRDSLFAIEIGSPGDPASRQGVEITLDHGRYSQVGTFVDSNRLNEQKRYILFVQDMRATALGYTAISLPLPTPESPIRLGDPAGDLYTSVVSDETGRVYGVVRRSTPVCSGWAIVRLEENTSQLVACAENVLPDVVPQRMFVSADEAVSAFSYIRRGRIIGDLQDMAVLTAGGRGAEIFDDAGRIPLDIRRSESTGDIYAVVYGDGEVFALTPGSGRRRTVTGPAPSLEANRRLFLIDDALVTFTQSATETTIHSVDVVSGTTKEFTISGSFIHAYEHGGYLMFRLFRQAGTPQVGTPDVPAVETFVGFCTSALRQPGGSTLPTETFQVTLPPFARQTAAFTHSFSCP